MLLMSSQFHYHMYHKAFPSPSREKYKNRFWHSTSRDFGGSISGELQRCKWAFKKQAAQPWIKELKTRTKAITLLITGHVSTAILLGKLYPRLPYRGTLPTHGAMWPMALPLTVSCLTPLPGFEYRPRHEQNIPVTLAMAVVFAGYSGLILYFEVAKTWR